MSAHAVSPVHPLIPLALLEAVREQDAPAPDGLQDYHDELAAKRLGMSRTVAWQIDRFASLARREARVDAGEVTALLRLLGRRADAAEVFTDAGHRAAQRAAVRLPATVRGVWRILPRPLRNAFGLVLASRALRRYMGLSVTRDGERLVAEGNALPSSEATPDGSACAFYGSAVSALLRRFTDFDGTVQHVTCRARGDNTCAWHPESLASQ